MRLVLCLAFGAILGFLIPDSLIVNADCPECYNDYKPLEGRASEGRPATINGRSAISVKIDGSWDTSPGSHQTNTNVWNAVNSALNTWNTTNSVSGQPSNYYLDLRQSDANAQITIMRGGTAECATTSGKLGGPYVIHLPDNADQRTLNALIQTLVHEIGHVYGLAHTKKEDCPGNQSIMRVNSGKLLANGAYDPCGGTDRALTPNDVEKANITSATGGPQIGYCRQQILEHPFMNDPQGYIEPNYYYYPTTCYYYYEAVDHYRYCECAESGCQCSSSSYRGLKYVGTDYYLIDVFCY